MNPGMTRKEKDAELLQAYCVSKPKAGTRLTEAIGDILGAGPIISPLTVYGKSFGGLLRLKFVSCRELKNAGTSEGL